MRILRWLLGTVAIIVALAAAPDANAATCDDHSSQAAAQHAQDTRDADGDGIYCETLPCPCAGPTDTGVGAGGEDAKPQPTGNASCVRTRKVVRVAISRTKYPAVLRHIRQAVRDGWPRVLRINRDGADERRDRLLDDGRYPTRDGYDRDEWPMAFARKSWRAHVAYVPSSQNRGSGASIGAKLRRYCDGTKFKIIGLAPGTRGRSPVFVLHCPRPQPARQTAAQFHVKCASRTSSGSQ